MSDVLEIVKGELIGRASDFFQAGMIEIAKTPDDDLSAVVSKQRDGLEKLIGEAVDRVKYIMTTVLQRRMEEALEKALAVEATSMPQRVSENFARTLYDMHMGIMEKEEGQELQVCRDVQ